MANSEKPGSDWPDLAYSGSVKDIYGPDQEGYLYFRFSDRYSIFDWGEMPDQLPDKGNALAVMGDLFFRVLKEQGIHSHCEGLLSDDRKRLMPGSVTKNLMVRAVPVTRPEEQSVKGKLSYDYSFYESRPEDGLVPLEVIFRFGVPQGSSLLKRLSESSSYAATADLKAGDWLPEPIVEFSTKLEPSDRILSASEAMAMAGLNEVEFESLKTQALDGAKVLALIFREMNLELWDGKLEFAFQAGRTKEARDFLLVDSIGPDELRLLNNGIQISKEYLRQVYTGSPWELALREAKKLAAERGVADWKQICQEELGQSPEPLPKEVVDAMADMYRAMANELAIVADSERPFPNTQSLEFMIKALKQLKESNP